MGVHLLLFQLTHSKKLKLLNTRRFRTRLSPRRKRNHQRPGRNLDLRRVPSQKEVKRNQSRGESRKRVGRRQEEEKPAEEEEEEEEDEEERRKMMKNILMMMMSRSACHRQGSQRLTPRYEFQCGAKQLGPNRAGPCQSTNVASLV